MNKKPKKTDGFEDISSSSKPKRKKKNKTKETLIAVLCFILCIVLVVSGALAIIIRSKFSKMNFGDGFGGNPDATFLYEEENLNFQQISDIENAESVKELVKSWATNGGDKLYSKNVINVLLIGEDDEDGSHRSDSTMLLTVNKKTKKITLTSFLRDSYTYMNIAGQDRYDKTNHSYSWGGAAKLMEVLSNNYKIKIDHFVSINYRSFVDAVDELGGVSVMVTDAEANFMNRTTKMKGFESGPNVRLDGEHALVFARIRKLDGEPERTERQRRLITSLITSVRSSTLSDLNNAIDKFLPYVSTNYSKSEILSLGTKAITEGWLNYEIVSQVAPSEETRMGFTGYRTYTGNLDVWIVDYVKASRELQLSLYGNTNIVVDEETHVSAIDLALGSKKAYDSEDEEETTNGFFSQLPDINVTIPRDQLQSYIEGILRPDRQPTTSDPYSEEETENNLTEYDTQEYVPESTESYYY
mgnify:CR=1 FL=1